MKQFCIYVFFAFAFVFSSITIFCIEPQLIWEKEGGEANTNIFLFSNDGKFIYTQYSFKTANNTSYFLQKWNIENKKMEQETPYDYPMNKMIFTHDGKFILGIASKIKYLYLYDINSGETKIINDIKDSSYNSVNSIAISENDNYIYAYHSLVKEIQIIEMNTLKRIDSINISPTTYLIRFSEDGKFACTANGDSSISIWDINLKKEKYHLKIPFSNYSITNVFVNSEYFIINYMSTVQSYNVELYSMETGKLVTRTKSGFKNPHSIIHNDNTTILTAPSPAYYLEKFDINTSITTKTNILINGYQMKCSPTDNFIVGMDSLTRTYLFDLTTEKPIMFLSKISENLSECIKVIISPDKKYVYAAGSKNADTLKRGQVIEYDFKTGAKTNVFQMTNNSLLDMVMSKDGTKLCVLYGLGKIDIVSNFRESQPIIKSYDLNKNNDITKYISTTAISDDNSKLIAGGYFTGFYYVNLKTDSIIWDFEDPYKILEIDPDIKTIALNKKGDKFLLGGKKRSIFEFNYNSDSDKYVKSYDFISDESTNYQRACVNHVAFSYNEKYFYSSTGDGYTHIYDSKNYKETGKFKALPDTLFNYPTSAALTKNNNKIILGDVFRNLSIYDVQTGEQLWTKKSNEFHYYQINSITLSEDDEYMAYCVKDGSLGLYKIDEKTSVNEIEDNTSFRIYPNPSSDYLEISSINPTLKRGVDEGLEIRIFNTLGEIVMSLEQTSPSVQRIDISNLSPGIYFIKIGNKVEKFVKM